MDDMTAKKAALQATTPHPNFAKYHKLFPTTSWMRRKAPKNVPLFAFEYGDTGAGNDIGIDHNWAAFDNVTIVPLPAKCPSSTRSRTSGSSCVTTGCQTACSHPTTPSSITAALRGTSSPTSPGASCRSAYEIVQEVPLSESWYQPRVSRFL